MKKTLLVFVMFLMILVNTTAQQTIQERLGYPKETKLLIIHADDLGVSHAQNSASITAFEKGSVSSGSIMVPCPWFLEIANYAISHPQVDLGLHLTLTSEWKFYKWTPVGHDLSAAVLTDANGYFNENLEALMKNGTAESVERELRSQINLALKAGVKPTHFDAHMACVFSTAQYLQILIKLGHEFKVPVLLNREAEKYMFNVDLDKFITKEDVVVDKILMATPDDYKNGMSSYYTHALKSLQPGLTCLLLHAAYDNDEMKNVTIDHPDYGAAWRQADFNFFTSEACKKLLIDEKIKVITWREIQQKLIH